MLWLSARLTTAAPCWPGISGHLLDRLQSILNAAARLVFSARRSERITLLLRDLHWLRVPERIQLRLLRSGIPMCQWINDAIYLAESVRRTADVEGHRHHSSTTMTLVVPSVQRSTPGDRAACRCIAGIEQPNISEPFHPSPPSATTEDTSV